jgi:hypothetical protein
MSLGVNLHGVGDQPPENIEREQGAESGEVEHAAPPGAGWLYEKNAKGQKKRQQSLSVEDVSGARIVGHDGPQAAVQPQPDKALGELVQGEEAGHGGKQ